MPLNYDKRTGQYRNDRGQFVPRTEVLRTVDKLSDRLATRLKAQSRLLIAGKISLAQWQVGGARSIKEAHIQAALFAAGGEIAPSYYGEIEAELRRQYRFLDRFALALQDGRLTEAQLIRRSQLYGKSARIAFGKAEKNARAANGMNAGKRLLDAQASHCIECIAYHRPDWVPIGEIVPPGVNCSCQNNCKCRVIYAAVDLSRRGILAA
jgi:hypothetical protein